MNKKVKIGILGCASIAWRYSIAAFQNIPNAGVVSVASRDLEKARTWAKKFGIRKAESYGSLINNPEVDAVYIPLPIGLHKEWILKAVRSGKHVLCEKSLAPNLGDVKEIINACRENNAVLYENFTCDYHPQHTRVVELLNSNEIGKPYIFNSMYGFPIIEPGNFRYNSELGGSGLNESGAYQVYTVRKLFNKEPKSVFAKLEFSNNVDMNGSILMEFDDNFTAIFSYNLDAVYQNYYTIWGSKGLIKVGRAYAIAPSFKPVIEVVKNENRQEIITALDIPAHNHFETIFAEFCDCVLNLENRREKIESIYTNILNQAKVLEATRISSNEKRRVDIKEIT